MTTPSLCTLPAVTPNCTSRSNKQPARERGGCYWHAGGGGDNVDWVAVRVDKVGVVILCLDGVEDAKIPRRFEHPAPLRGGSTARRAHLEVLQHTAVPRLGQKARQRTTHSASGGFVFRCVSWACAASVDAGAHHYHTRGAHVYARAMLYSCGYVGGHATTSDMSHMQGAVIR